MDYAQPIEALIPGVQGRVLGILACTETEMTIRTVARLSGVSPQQASVVIAELVNLGIATRREAGSSALIRLERENEAARFVISLGALGTSVLARLSKIAKDIVPAPKGLIVFGSFARGEATATSDLDALAVRAEGVSADDSDWNDALGKWEQTARQIVGNPVNILVISAGEVSALLRRRTGPWRAIANEGIALAGSPLSALNLTA